MWIEDEVEVGSVVGGKSLGVVLLLRMMLPAPPRPNRVVVLLVDIAGSVRRYGGGYGGIETWEERDEGICVDKAVRVVFDV